MNTQRFTSIVTFWALLAIILSACSPASGAAPGGSGYSAPSGEGAPLAAAPASDSGSAGGGKTASQFQPGRLTAGDVDDNLNFAFYQRYLSNTLQEEIGKVLPSVVVDDRVTIRILGDDQQGISNAWVRITPVGSQTPILQTYAASDGTLDFFPTLDGAKGATQFTIEARYPDGETPLLTIPLNLEQLNPERTIEISMVGIPAIRPEALDLVLVIDTTSSMSDEMNYLTTEFRNIVKATAAKYPRVAMRFGLVVYRDAGDEYVVRSFDFVESAEEMETQLAAQQSAGGGDYPEAVDQALRAALQLNWRGGNTARLLFWVADAPSHADKHAVVLQEALKARQMGLRMYPLAASGVLAEAEYLMRVSALLTHGRYLFLTDDSGVGNQHAEPKIPCYVVTRLNELMIRVIEAELAGVRVEPGADQILRQVGSYDGGMCFPQKFD